MIVSHALLQILDFKAGKNYLSDVELDLGSSTTIEYILKIFNTCLNSTLKKKGTFNQEGEVKDLFIKYKDNKISFLELANKITEDLNLFYQRITDCPSFDLIFGDFSLDSVKYFGFVLIENKETLTHKIETVDGKALNIVVKNLYTLPTSGISINNFALINLDTLDLYCSEKKRQVDGNNIYILQEYLKANFSMSESSQYKIIKNITTRISEENGVNPAIAMSKVKTFLMDNPVIENMKPEDISSKVFDTHPEAKASFDAKMHANGIVNNINLERGFVLKKADVQKIKTDTEIEISIPIEYVSNKDYVEFIDEDDGTTSIRIKNINKIINK